MKQRLWPMTCGLACVLALMSAQTLAAPRLTPVPLVQPTALSATWGHVESYEGSYSGDIQSTSSGGWHEHFTGNVTLLPLLPGHVVGGMLNFQGSTGTTQIAGGYCGSADTEQPTEVVLDLDIATHKYDLHLIPGPGSVALTGGSSTCTHPFARVFAVAQFDALQALLPAPSAGICGTETFYRSGHWGNETDTLHWSFVPVANVHWAIKLYCPSIINGVAPLH